MASAEFIDWCDSVGIQRYGIEAGYVAHGWRGVIAMHDIEPGQCLLEVPESVLMTRRSALLDRVLEAALKKHPSLGPVQVLGAHLLSEVSKSQGAKSEEDMHRSGADQVSPWHLYLEQLPRRYTTLCNWSPTDIEAMQLGHAREDADSAVENSKDLWRGVLPLLKDLGLPRKFLGLSAWLWAHSTLMSRTMYVPFDPVGGALTPFGDLHNYLPPPPPFKPDILKGLQYSRATPAGNLQYVGYYDHDVCSNLQETPHEATAHTDRAEHIEQGFAELNLSLEEEGASATQEICVDQGGEGHRELMVSINQVSETSPTPERRDEEDEVGDGHFDADAGVYRLVSRRQYNKGQEVFLCYGRHTNLELLEHYGFMLDDNPHEAAVLPVTLVLNQVDASGFHASTDNLKASDSFIHIDGRPSWGLLLALRTMAASPGERRRSGHLLAAGERISLSGDLRAMLWLRGACLDHLNSMPTTLAEDQELLRSLVEAEAENIIDEKETLRSKSHHHPPQTDLNYHLAIQWRTCQKIILHKAVLEAERCDLILSSHLRRDEVDRIKGRGMSKGTRNTNVPLYHAKKLG